MDSCPLTFAMGFQGSPTGITGSPELTVSIRHVASCEFSGAGKQVVNRTSDQGTPYTIGPSGTLSLDLTTGLQNPLGEAIGGGAAFAKLYVAMVIHDSASTSSGIKVFGGASQPFQGPWSAGSSGTFAPGFGFGIICQADKAGWPVTMSSACQIDIVNLDPSNSAIVNVFTQGTTS